jgi:hypothetical protein
VTYGQLYPGIDLVFHDERGALEYDLVVAPGADPSSIRLAFDGTTAALRSPDGGLLLRSDRGDVIQHRPIAYQEVGTVRSDVPGRFLGSPGAGDQTTRVRTDGQGNAYVLGVTNHLLGEQHDFPTTPGAFQTDSPANQVHFLANLRPTGI